MVDSRAVIEAWLQAAEAGDVSRIVDMLAEDVSMETELLSTPIRGKSALRDLMQGPMSAFGEIRIEPRKLVVSGNDVAAFLRIRVKFGNDLKMFGETLVTAGKEIDIVGAIFAEVNEAGEISRVMRVRDTLSLVRQLGLAPERLESLMRKLEHQVEEKRSAA
jgi:predicted ester cyclase